MEEKHPSHAIGETREDCPFCIIDALEEKHPSHAIGETREDCPFCIIDARVAATMADLLNGRIPAKRLA